MTRVHHSYSDSAAISSQKGWTRSAPILSRPAHKAFPQLMNLCGLAIRFLSFRIRLRIWKPFQVIPSIRLSQWRQTGPDVQWRQNIPMCATILKGWSIMS